MALAKRLAVTLPAGPKLEHSVARIKWAEDNGYPDVWFADAGAPDSLTCLLYTSPSPRDKRQSRMPSSA